MSELLSKYVGHKVAVLVQGPKGIIAMKGKLLREDSEFIEIQTEKGMLGGKETTTAFSKTGIVGVRMEA